MELVGAQADPGLPPPTTPVVFGSNGLSFQVFRLNTEEKPLLVTGRPNPEGTTWPFIVDGAKLFKPFNNNKREPSCFNLLII